MISNYVSPLIIYVVWHPESPIGKQLGHKLFSSFCSNVELPFGFRLGIPVYFRWKVNNDGNMANINFNETDRTVILCLIDEHMILDDASKQYTTNLYAKCSQNPSCKFIPVALTKAAFKLDADIGALNYIRAYEVPKEEGNDTALIQYVYHNLLHELCKMFINSDNTDNQPIKLFISHSKHDSVVNIATSFRDYINSNEQLKTFFDSNDIGFGDDFGRTIEENAGKCVVVAFLSDSYASREWCRTEIIVAKKNHCPIVLVNALTNGEKRSFPYLGNVPTKRWDGDNKTIVNLALEAALTNFFIKEALDKQAKLFKISHDFILSNYPELFSIIGIKQKLIESKKEAGIIIYPDPPLGNEELKLLNEMDDRLSFVTPLQLSSFIS